MKKLSLGIFAFLTVMGTAFAGTGSVAPFFGNTPAHHYIDKSIPNFKGVENFMRLFPQAYAIAYKVNEKFTEVSFTWNNLQLEAFIDLDGNLIATSRKIPLQSLPIGLQINIRNQYPGGVCADAIEFNNAETGLCYYVTVVNPEKTYILHVTPDGLIDVFKKVKN